MKNVEDGVTTFAEQEDEVRHDLTRQHRRKIPSLTGIRGVAALWVVLLHMSTTGKILGIAMFSRQIPIVDTGYLGVDLFFVLSGFVLMMTYGASISTRWSGVRDFAIGRAFRILPLHWTVLLLFAVVSPMIGERWLTTEPHDLGSFMLSASLFQTALRKSMVWNTPAWSLSAEWICYFFFPIAAFALFRIERKPVLLAAVVIPLAILFAFVAMRHSAVTLGMTNRDGIARCGTEMIAGIALYRLCILSPPDKETGNRMAIAGLALLAIAMAGSYAEFAALPGFVLLIAACYSLSPITAGLFGNRVIHWLGEISFSIYILHWLLFEIAAHVARAQAVSGDLLLVAVLLPPVIVLPLAWLLWRQVEVRGQAAGRVVIARLRAHDAARAPLVTSSAR